MNARTDFWKGDFGNQYHGRAPGDPEANYHLFRHALAARRIQSIIELGAGTGANLLGLRKLIPHAELCGVEVNEAACQELAKRADQVITASVLDLAVAEQWDLAFTKGLLIHIAPEDLPKAYDSLVGVSRRYVLVAEYYNPTPVEVLYRGHAGRLWKRDFAGELIDRYGLRLLDYGFVYRRDLHPQDDLTWFLMEKP